MEISERMVLYIVAGIVLIVAIIATKGEVIRDFFISISGCLIWIFGVLALICFVTMIIFIPIPDPIFAEIWLGALSALNTLLGIFTYIARRLSRNYHPSYEPDRVEGNDLSDRRNISIAKYVNLPSDTEIHRIINSQEEFPDQKTIQEIIKEAENKLEDDTEFANSTDIESIIDNSSSLLRLIRAYASKNYREIPTKSILAAVAAITYFVNPYDMIPDSIPGVGHIDDEAVINFTLNLIHEDLEKFQKWERQNENG